MFHLKFQPKYKKKKNTQKLQLMFRTVENLTGKEGNASRHM